MYILSSWIISVLGIIIISVLIEIILPNGKTVNLIKGILGVFSIFVMISPLKKINFSNLDINFFNNEINVNQTFVENRKEEIVNEYEKIIVKNLDKNGYYKTKITLEISSENNCYKIKTIYVDLREMVLKSEDLNINKYTNLIAIIKNVIEIEEEKIIFYE